MDSSLFLFPTSVYTSSSFSSPFPLPTCDSPLLGDDSVETLAVAVPSTAHCRRRIQQLPQEAASCWKGRPVEQQNGQSTIESTDAPESTGPLQPVPFAEGPLESTPIDSTQPPSTGAPGGTPPPPQSSSAAPPTGGTGAPGGTTTTDVSTTTRCSVGIWSEWREDMSCNAQCGACGTVVRRRTCTTAAAGCPCDGDFRESRPCRISACPYPQPACCPPATLIYVNGTFACGPQNEVVMAEYLTEIGARASATTKGPKPAIIATRPHRTSPTGFNRTTTTPVVVTTLPGPTVGPTGATRPVPTGPVGTEPTSAPGTTEAPKNSTETPVDRTTEAVGEETTAAGQENKRESRPWYHRLKSMKNRPIEEEIRTSGEDDEIDPRPWYHRLNKTAIEETATPMWLQQFA